MSEDLELPPLVVKTAKSAVPAPLPCGRLPTIFLSASAILPRTSLPSSKRRFRSSISRRKLARVSNQKRVVSCALSPELFR